MTVQEIIAKIRSRGYWKVQFQPESFDENLIGERSKLKDIVESSIVQLRGWDYPHFSHWNDSQNRRAIYGTDYIEGGCDWNTQVEFWRMYQSGQFIHLFAMDEDWFKEDDWYSSHPDLQAIEPGDVLGITSAVYIITEIFEFLHRLTKDGVYNDNTHVSIAVGNTENRELKILNGAKRAPLFFKYKSPQEYIEYKKTFFAEDIMNNHKSAAIDAICWLFETFGWENPPRNVFEKDQQDLYEKRF